MTIFQIRAFLAMGGFILCNILCCIVLLGHDYRKPLTGLRGWLKHQLYWFFMKNIIFWAFMNVKYEYVDSDYSDYLGKDYKKTQVLPEKSSTIVSNH